MTATMLETIQDLLDGDSVPSLASLEATLTDGYAQALSLEGERLRLERRLRALVRTPGPRSGDRSRAIAELTERVGDADRTVQELRSRLTTLRRHHYDPRVAAEAGSI
jgi:hypothetical protein